MKRTGFPTSADELTPEMLTELIRERYPGTRVESFRVIEASRYGDGNVSTSGRMVLDLSYAEGVGLAERVMIKVARTDVDGRALYENEVAFYERLGAEVPVELPMLLGSRYDPLTGHFGLILEDLRVRSVRFPTVVSDVSLDDIKSLLVQLAALHGRYWQTPRFDQDLNWVQTHLKGALYALFNDADMMPAVIQSEIDNERFKREMVQRLRSDGPSLLAGVQALQRHQATLPQTLLHGDTHIGNTYFSPDGTGGLLDWQLLVRGYFIHDIAYLLTTALSIEARRQHERELIAYYLDRLAASGVTAPSFDDAWLEYRRAAIWGVYVGWLTTPVANYGWEICVMNHLRLMTAYEDHGTVKLIEQIL